MELCFGPRTVEAIRTCMMWFVRRQNAQSVTILESRAFSPGCLEQLTVRQGEAVLEGVAPTPNISTPAERRRSLVTEVPQEWNELDGHESSSPLPVHFATENSSSVAAQTGTNALIPCVVNNIGDGMVSWIRRKDYHLLTVGLTTYSGDERFQVVHIQHSEDWTLQIKFVQHRDAGLYECQVSSHPPQSIFIDLRVVEARAEISGAGEKYLKLGSSLRLVCSILQSTEPPVYVFWYHNNRMVNYDGDRGVNVTTDKPAKTSTLLISSATKDHSGNYSCVPSNAQPASTYVHILNGENPAAMQHGGRGLSWLRCPSAWLLIACLLASITSTSSRLAP